MVEAGRRDKGIGDDFAVAQSPAQLAGLGLQAHFPAVAALGGGAPEGGGGNLVVSVQSAHLLGDVRREVQIRPPGGNVDGAPLHRDLQAAEVSSHVRLGDVRTQQAVDPVRLQLQLLRLRHVMDDVDDPVQHVAAGQRLHQLARPLDGGGR